MFVEKISADFDKHEVTIKKQQCLGCLRYLAQTQHCALKPGQSGCHPIKEHKASAKRSKTKAQQLAPTSTPPGQPPAKRPPAKPRASLQQSTLKLDMGSKTASADSAVVSVSLLLSATCQPVTRLSALASLGRAAGLDAVRR